MGAGPRPERRSDDGLTVCLFCGSRRSTDEDGHFVPGINGLFQCHLRPRPVSGELVEDSRGFLRIRRAR